MEVYEKERHVEQIKTWKNMLNVFKKMYFMQTTMQKLTNLFVHMILPSELMVAVLSSGDPFFHQKQVNCFELKYRLSLTKTCRG